jgi:hypothetical protein
MPSTVIILGAARSGTKFLRDLLGASAVVRVVPHDVNYVWRHGNETYPDDAIPASRCTEDIGRFVRRRLLGLAGTSADSGHTVVEKTVSNTLRVDFVRAVYPEAKLIHLIRDGRAVVESAMRQWREKPDWRRLARKAMTLKREDVRYALWFAGNMARGRATGRGGGRVWGPRYPGIDEDLATRPLLDVCGRQWSVCVQATLDSLGRVPSDLVHTVRYEDLVSRPDAVEALAAFVGLPDVDAVLERYRSARIGDADRKWRSAFDADQQERVGRVITPLMSRLGYVT